MIENKPLCYAPFIGMYATSTGQYAPCCVSKTIHSHSPVEFWTSNSMQDIRLKMMQQEWPESCSYCQTKQTKNLGNDIKIWDDSFNSVKADVEITNGNNTGGPLFLDYRPSNICNLKCRMCTPQSSSQIEKEIIENPILNNWFTLDNNKINNFDVFLEYTSNLNLKKIKILGGEPTIDESTILFLEKIINNNRELPILRFTTNGTNLNTRFRKIMSFFPEVRVNFSIDGTEKVYEYIRTNANWHKTKKNIENVFKKNLASQYVFNTLLMPYNIFHLTDLLEWYYELYKKGYKFNLYFDTSDITFTSLSAVLPEDIDYAIESTKRFFEHIDPSFIVIDGMSNLLPLLNTSKFNKYAHNQFKQYNLNLDDIRKTKLLDIDKRFINYC